MKTCKYCGLKTRDLYNLKVHMKRKHKLPHSSSHQTHNFDDYETTSYFHDAHTRKNGESSNFNNLCKMRDLEDCFAKL